MKALLDLKEFKKKMFKNLVDHAKSLVVGDKIGRRSSKKDRDKSEKCCYYCKEKYL